MWQKPRFRKVLRLMFHFQKHVSGNRMLSHISVTPNHWSTDKNLFNTAYTHCFNMITSPCHGTALLGPPITIFNAAIFNNMIL